ncbi:MAG: phosphoribosylamine--glycine ligase [Candidatus Woesearchaeota archaeon]
MDKVLIIGSGGREHALGWKLGQSPEVSHVIYAPGNAGTQEGKGRNINVDGSKKENFNILKDFIYQEKIDMVIVGPEAPLAEGIVDYLNSRGFDRVFGPTKNASLLESDKFYSHNLMTDLYIPRADSRKCYSTAEAIKAIKAKSTKDGIVIKARGLTGGKGVTVCNSQRQALDEIINHAEKYGPEVLIAERLFGQEFSVFGISDGYNFAPLEISLQDHKSLLDGDKGSNTGGMGAYGPAPVASTEIIRYVSDDILTPIIREMKERGNEYKGFLYGGFMMTRTGPKVIEFNIRFGDPECQPMMMMLKSDLYNVLSASFEGNLDKVKMEFNPGAACCVVLASKGYPESYKKGSVIIGLDEANMIHGVKVFHAGTTSFGNQVLTNGGRVLGVTGYSPEGIADAQRLAYDAVSKIQSVPEGFHYRTDIADKALK